MGLSGEMVAKRSYKEALVGQGKSTGSSTSCRILSTNPAAAVLKIRGANGRGGPEVVNPRFLLKEVVEQFVLQRVQVAQGVSE